mmetsp:Transcript_6605/g.10076  ORF Transcript_6605/g.10076 Transcript_6605/m.10076 type:complete len:164 (-) Transcript_6605:256-747(-)
MGELIGLCLMPAYAIGCWIGLYKNADTGKHLLPAALFGWIWAIINIMRSKRIDLGVVTFGLVIIFTLLERYYGFTRGVRWAISAAALAVAANFSLVVVFWKPIQKDLSRSKSQLWLKVFFSYCFTLMIFWIVSAYNNFVRGEPSTSSYSSVNTSLLNVESDEF